MTLLSEDDQKTLRRLQAQLNTDTRGTLDTLGFDSLNAYYDGVQRLRQLGLAVPDDLREFTTLVSWPGTYIDAVEERLDIVGFRLPGEAEVDEHLGEVWQANDLDDESQMGHVDALALRRGYACIGVDEESDLPLVTVESPLQMIHEWSNRERRVTVAGRFYEEGTGSTKERRATLYKPDETIYAIKTRKGWEYAEDPDEHELGRVLVEPLVNRARTHDRYGRTEMLRVISITDAACRALTVAQLGTELLGVPQRFAAGMTEADFKDPETGKVLTAWEAYLGAVWATANPDAKFGQFQAADLGNFVKIVDHYAQQIAGATGLPMRYLGQLSTNPPSADGIRADESRLVKTCERKQRALGASWERVMRVVRLVETGEDDPKLANMETVWRDPSTPTRAQAADATVKLFQQGIISRRQARKDLGYSPVQIQNMEADDAEARTDPTLDRIATGLLNADTGLGE